MNGTYRSYRSYKSHPGWSQGFPEEFNAQRCFSFHRGGRTEALRQLGRAVDFVLAIRRDGRRDLSFLQHTRSDRAAGGAEPDSSDCGRRALFSDSGDGIELHANRRRRWIFVETLVERLLEDSPRQPAADSARLADCLSFRKS